MKLRSWTCFGKFVSDFELKVKADWICKWPETKVCCKRILKVPWATRLDFAPKQGKVRWITRWSEFRPSYMKDEVFAVGRWWSKLDRSETAPSTKLTVKPVARCSFKGRIGLFLSKPQWLRISIKGKKFVKRISMKTMLLKKELLEALYLFSLT